MLNSIFTEGWEYNVLLYGLTFLLAEYAVYKIVFRALAGVPQSYRYEDQWRWYQKASILSSAIFAPLFEEVMITWLAYSSFLRYAQAGQEGVVILFVALFFGLLHLPVDLRQTGRELNGRKLYRLFKGQVTRFFYALAAYYIYQYTDLLWVTIGLHYLFNILVSIFNFDLIERPHFYEERDGRLLLILLLDLGFALLGTYSIYRNHPALTIYLVLPIVFLLYDFRKVYLT